jgi:hypothetical protein
MVRGFLPCGHTVNPAASAWGTPCSAARINRSGVSRDPTGSSSCAIPPNADDNSDHNGPLERQSDETITEPSTSSSTQYQNSTGATGGISLLLAGH